MQVVSAQASWWHGKRGEWYVLGQAGLFLLVALGPRTAPWLPPWPAPFQPVSPIVGLGLMIGGLLVTLAGAAQLGRSLSALPHPRDGAPLIDTGAFALVRHPMYCGAVWASTGWALYTRGWLTLSYAVLLAVFFEVKASREERWLVATVPGYAAYCRRVRKWIPFIY